MQNVRHIFMTSVASLVVVAASVAAQTQAPIPFRGGVSQKGSLLVFPAVEIKWDSNGHVSQDTILSITNDYQAPVYMQLYLVNGDAPLDAVVGDVASGYSGERSHPGWNWADCQVLLTANQPTYWSALTGLPAGCQPFTALDDDGLPPGRPDLEGPPGSRVLRGFVIGWAVDIDGHEIRWNHLSGDAMVVHYGDSTAWEYGAYAFQSRISEHGAPTDELPGALFLNGSEYDAPPEKLLFLFNATGGQFYSGDRAFANVDTDLTLMPMVMDLRQDSVGPVTTKAKFDIWNMNETRFSGTERCVTCWDQTLLGRYDVPNNFLRHNLQTDVGKARVDGIASTRCDKPGAVCTDRDGFRQVAGKSNPIEDCSFNVSIIGVASRLLAIEGTACGNAAAAGSTLVGMGEELGIVLYDIIDGPSEAQAPREGELSRISRTAKPQKRNEGGR